MDEPSAILDEGEIETLFDVVRRLTAEGVGVIYISHRLDEIRRIGNRVTVLADGRTTATRHPGDDADRRARRADDRPQGRAALSRAARRHRRGPARRPRRPAAPGGARREPPGARRRGRSASAAWSARGAASCSGSSTALDLPDEGEVWLEGKRLPPRARRAAIKAGLGLAPEDRKSQGLVLDWSLAKNVSLRRPRPLPPPAAQHPRGARARRASSCAR